MKNLQLLLIVALTLLSCQQESPLCEYTAQGQTNYVTDIITATDTLSLHPDFNFPYTSPFLEELQEDLSGYTGQEAMVTVDPSRVITIQVRSEIEFLKAVFSNYLDGSFPEEGVFQQLCE